MKETAPARTGGGLFAFYQWGRHSVEWPDRRHVVAFSWA